MSLVLPGWTCECGAFNGSAKEDLAACRSCGKEKTKMGPDTNDEMVKMLVDALRAAHKELAEQTGWSGSSGNWPLQDAEAKARLALEAFDRSLTKPASDERSDGATMCCHEETKRIVREGTWNALPGLLSYLVFDERGDCVLRDRHVDYNDGLGTGRLQ